MSKTIFKKENKSLIPNAQLESMFLSICNDKQMMEYNRLIDKGLIHTASAYASHKVQKTFQYLRDSFIKNGGDMDYLQYFLWERDK